MSRALEHLVALLRPRPGEEGALAERPRDTGRTALAPARRRVDVTGRVSAVTSRARGRGVCDLVVDLEPFVAGAPPTSLVMLGRREIVGIRPGTVLRVHGRAASVKSRVTLFNPAYELVLEEVRP